jgi:transposase
LCEACFRGEAGLDVKMDGSLDGSTDGYAGRIEVLEGRSGRRLRSEAERARIAAESLVPGAKVADVARWHGATRWQVYDWRRKLTSGALALSEETMTEPAFAALVVESRKRRRRRASRRRGRRLLPDASRWWWPG